jgi:HEPN domain-containing protein
MPENSIIPGSCEDWLKRARADLALAKIPLPEGGMLEDLAFHAQQAAEKAIKAIYIQKGMRFRYTHDIAKLLSGLAATGLNLNEEIKSSADLTIYASESRYPFVGEPVTEEEYQEAVRLAEMVVTWAERQIR